MALKPITLRLDEEEYEKLRKSLSDYGDPDLNVAYVIRTYIRDLNRAMPHLKKSLWDLKGQLGVFGMWLKSASRITEVELLAKGRAKKLIVGIKEGKE